MKSMIKKILTIFFFSFLLFLGWLFVWCFGKYIHIPCVFHEFTGLLCPGCGMTRAFIAISNGNFLQAIYYNFLIIFLIPIFSIYAFYNVYSFFQHRKFVSFSSVYPRNLTIFFLIFCLMYGIVRNFFSF